VAKAGARAGLIAFSHDPNGHLERLESPTVLDVPRTLANYGGAFGAVAVVALAIGLVSGAIRRRRGEPPEPSEGEEGP
jgi:hypothetical protein